MKDSWRFQCLTALVFGIGPVAAFSQTYFDSGPVIGVAEAALTPDGLGNGDFVFDFGTVTENLYYNPAALSLEAVGSVTVSPSTGSFDISGTSQAPGVGSATLNVGNDGNVSFDMVFQYVGNSGGNPDFFSDLFVPVSGRGMFNGEPFSGNWNLMIPINLQVRAASPTSFSFTEINVNGANPGNFVVPGSDLVDGNSDSTYAFSWNVSHVATTVPEPSPLAMLATALLPVAVWRKLARFRQASNL